jgi:hypothetical protein
MRERMRRHGGARNGDIDIVLALENARTRFAVAVATEKKTTAPKLWRSYFETEDRLRRCLKTLRAPGHSGLSGNRECALAMEILVQRSAICSSQQPDGEAKRLCGVLQEALKYLEREDQVSGNSTALPGIAVLLSGHL